jgi:hypothetical protein
VGNAWDLKVTPLGIFSQLNQNGFHPALTEIAKEKG